MKKYLILALVFLILVISCAVSFAKAPSETLVALAISYTGNSFMTALMDGLREKFESAGYRFEVASAEMDALKQIQQIENFVAMGADLIIVMAVDPTALTDVCKRAMEAGVKVFAFTTDTGAYHLYAGANERILGEAAAEMVLDWINKTFPGDEKIEVAIFEYKGTPESKERSEGLEKMMTMSDRIKVKIVELPEPTFLEGQSTAENIFQANPEIRAVLCYNAGIAQGVNAFVMSPAGSALVPDKSKFGVFAVDYSQEVGELIKASAENKSVFRGTISLGSIEYTIQKVYDLSVQLLNSDWKEPQVDYAEAWKITPEVLLNQ